MNIPAAFTSLALRLGRTFDTETSSARGDIFPTGIQTELKDVNTVSFKYKVVSSNKDVKELLGIAGELSLKIKAGILNVEGKGKYINETKTEDGTTNLLAVMKCTTAIETIVGQPTTVYDEAFIQGLGDHYVRSVVYGAEMVASVKFQPASSLKRVVIHGGFDGQLSPLVAKVGLKASLDKFSSECNDVSDITIEYYATDMPDKLPLTLEDLVSLIENFPSRLQRNNGKGIPMTFELLPTKDIIPIKTARIQQRVLEYDIEELENRLDDLRNAKASAERYLKSTEETHADVSSFISKLSELLRCFYSAISSLKTSEGQKKVDACLDAYKQALDGYDVEGKFVQEWKKILGKKRPTEKPLTIVLLGKTGNGKSATGNGIIGKEQFDVSDGAQSETEYCQKGTGTINNREVTVIDTPGILDTSVVKLMGGYKHWLPAYKSEQERILTELAKMYTMAPQGFDAIILVAKFGARFTAEDAQALNLLKCFLGKESESHMILLLTRGDEAARNARKKSVSPVDKYVRQWIDGMPEWVRDFIHKIGDRLVLFNNSLDVDTEDYHRQLTRLMQVIETMTKGKGPFVNDKTRSVMNSRIEDAVFLTRYTDGIEDLKKKLEIIQRQLTQDENLSLKEKKNLQDSRIEIEKKIEEYEKKEDAWRKQIEQSVRQKLKEEGGCYPGSAIFVDTHGRRRQMDSLEVGDEVQVIINNEIRAEPVITFIHCQPEVVQEFLQITTEKNNILKITEDHLLFVERTGKATAIPAREVKVGDTLYVRAGDNVEKDAVLSISKVFEKGVYAPVTLSGTILVNDVHTSCYFDVLSHEWSHRAMGVARAVHYVSPWILQWISGVGRKDGFPGWCRLAHKILTM